MVGGSNLPQESQMKVWWHLMKKAKEKMMSWLWVLGLMVLCDHQMNMAMKRCCSFQLLLLCTCSAR